MDSSKGQTRVPHCRKPIEPADEPVDKASLNSSPKEAVDETIGKLTLRTTESSTPQRAGNWKSREQQNELTIALMELLISAAEEQKTSS